MGIIKRGEVMFYRVGEEVICVNCVEDEELLKIKEEDIVVSVIPGECFYFCDRCGKQIA